MNEHPRLLDLYRQDLMPRPHLQYLQSIKDIEPKVVYDIGACVLHWYKKAYSVWPNARYIMFDALQETEFLYQKHSLEYSHGILSNENDKLVDFYYNVEMPGGCSYYQENEKINGPAARFYNDKHKRQMKTITLDTLAENKNYPLADLIKMDVQGAELDIIKGAPKCVEYAKDIILELQDVDYNKGAPKTNEVIQYMKSIGFLCVAKKFSQNIFDADYHFKNERYL